MGDPTAAFFFQALSFIVSIINTVLGVLSFLGQLVTSAPFLIFLITTSSLMYPIVIYQDVFIEYAEQTMRGVVYPFYRDTVRPILVFFQVIYDNLICWFNAIQYWIYGLFRFVILPTFTNCNITPTFNAALVFINTVIEDFWINYFFAEKFYYQPVDFTNVTATGIAAWLEWVKLYSCTCNDLSDLLKKLPIFPGFIPVLGLTSWFSLQWADPFMWKGIEYAVDGFMEILNQLLRLAIQGIHAIYLNIDPQGPYAEANFTRPDFYLATDYFVNSTDNIIISYENAIQLFWNMYIPFPFDFHGYFCWLQSLISFLLKTANFAITMLINIDKLLQYPMNDFWSTTARGLITENLNLVGVPSPFAPVTVYYAPNVTAYTMSNWYLPEDQKWIYPLWTNASLNPLYQKKRMSQCFCEFLTRTFCDPTNNGTACFPNSLLSTFDFCCLTNNATTIVLDLTTSVVELSYHTALGGDDIVLFFTNQPFGLAITNTMISIVRCLFALFSLIPDIGAPLQNFFTEGIAYWIRTFYFISVALIDTATLPFYNEFLPTQNASIEQTGFLLNMFVSINDQLVADTPNSFVNSLCYILNNGFPIPPVPCMNCTPGGFVPLAKRSHTERLTEKLGWFTPEGAYRVTPIMYYGNTSRIDFTDMAKRIWLTGPKANPINFDVDSYFDARQNEFVAQWHNKLTCTQQKEEEARLKKTKPHIWRKRKMEGKYPDCEERKTTRNDHKPKPERDPELDQTIIITSPAHEAYGLKQEQQQEERQAYPDPVATCNSATVCFDLCCVFRSTIKLYAHTANFFARFLNGFVQYQSWRYGTVSDFPYFTGELCDMPFNQPCFESDMITEVMLIFRIPYCLCEFLNLVVPLSMLNPRNNICCSIQRFSELIGSTITVIINALQSIAYGASDDPAKNYIYFTGNFFQDDVDTLFVIAYQVLECLCELLNFIFPVSYIPGLGTTNIDVCCSVRVLGQFGIEVGRFTVNTLIAIATFTINPRSYCYFRLDQDAEHSCGGTLDDIGIVKSADILIDTIFTIPDPNSECAQNCPLAGNGGGLAQCTCNILQSLIPARENPALGANCSLANLNCDTLDLCCFINQGAIVSNYLSKFAVRAGVSLIQSWAGGLPEFFINFIACDEDAGNLKCGQSNNACAYDSVTNRTAICGCGTYTCGILNPAIKALTETFSKCICVFLGFLDDYIAMTFTAMGTSWQYCFCGTQQSNGFFMTTSASVKAIVTQFVGLVRKFALPCYWNPSGVSSLYIGNNPAPSCIVGVTPGCYCKFEKRPITSIQDSWVLNFLGPILESQCASIGKLACFATALFFLDAKCTPLLERGLGSLLLWFYDLEIRIIVLIEGYVRTYAEPASNCVGPDPFCNLGQLSNSYMGVESGGLAKAVQALLQYFADVWIGDSAVSCSRICPRGTLGMNTCDCYKKAPNYNMLDANHSSVWIESTYLNGTDLIDTCLLSTQGVYDVSTEPYNQKGYNGISGVGAHLPRCASFSDYTKIPNAPENVLWKNGYPGVCAQYAMCRPDNLPICGLPDGSPPAQVAYSDKNPVDGLLMTLLRVLNCLLPIEFLQSFYRLGIILGSITWQLYGALTRITVSGWFVVLSLFSNVAPCDCYTSPDPAQGGKQTFFSQGTGFNIGFCYPCPDAYAQCGYSASQKAAISQCTSLLVPCYINQTVPQLCPSYCPVSQNATNAVNAYDQCVAFVTAFTSPQVRQSSPQCICSGRFEEYQIYRDCNMLNLYPFSQSDGVDCASGANITFTLGVFQTFSPDQQNCYNNQKQRYYNEPYKQQNCHINACMFGESGTFVNTRRWADTGSTENANPVVLCGFLQFLNAIVEYFNAWIALFTTPLQIPDYRRSVHKREGRVDFWIRTGLTKSYEFKTQGELFHAHRRETMKRSETDIPAWLKRINDIDPTYQSEEVKKEIHMYENRQYTTLSAITPKVSMPELMLMATYDYDTSDCFVDPVSCLCRNFHMPQYCRWDKDIGVIPTPGRKIFYNKRNTTKRQEGDISIVMDEAYMMIAEKFDGTTVCDHNIAMIAEDGIIGPAEQETWVKCVDKRIQSERMSDITRGIIPKDYVYNTHGMLDTFRNIVDAYRTGLNNKRQNMMQRRREIRSDFETRFPDFDNMLIRRTKEAELYLDSIGLDKSSMSRQTILKLDYFYSKYQTGYYSFITKRAYNNYQSGINYFPSVEESIGELQFAIWDLKLLLNELPYDKLYRTTREATYNVVEGVRDIITRGVVNTIVDVKRAFDVRMDTIHKRNAAKREVIAEKWRQTPLYQWWYSESPPSTRLDKTTFFKHISNVMAFRRAQRESQPSAVKQFKARFVPQWTEEQLQNWKKAGNVFRTLRSYIYPNEYTDSALVERGNERFLVDGDCQLFNALANYSINLFTPCLAQQVRNTRALQGGILEYYVNNVVPYYRGNYERKSITKHLKMDENMTYWKRWKTIDQPPKVVRKRVDHRVYKRAIASYNTGPAGFNLYDWAVAVLETWFNFLFTQDLNTWIDDAKAWISNPNTDYADFLAQNVGLSYWALFMIRCNIPENTNCVGGIGLGPAILWVGLGLIGLAIVSAFVLPVIAQVLAVLPVAIISIIIIFTIGLHYSPRCAVLGISPTIFSFVLPECLVGQVIQILDDLITNCYSPKYLPSCMIAGDLCPVDPNQYIDWLNCQVVGVSDGIQNVLFLGSITLGQPFMNVFLYLTQTTFGHWMPGLQEYMQTTLDGFKYAGPSQNCRQWWCFGLTFPAIALPLFLIILGVLVLGFIVPFVFALLLTTYSFWATSPAAIILPGSDQAQVPDFPEPQEQAEEENLDPVDKAKLDNMQCDIENARAFLRNYQQE